MSWAPPKFISEAAQKVIEQIDVNHYAVNRGRIRLRTALAESLSPSFNLPGGRKLDPNTEILVSAGANGGMYAYATAFLNPGDEVIVVEPFFDQYIAQIKFNGGTPVYVPLRAPKEASTGVVSANDWKVDMAELAAAVTPKTKQIWINTPHNPSGKVFSEDELRAIGNLAEKHDLMILSDEVYDCLTFDDHKHVRIAALDDFWRRTVTVGSAGKSFSATGWRVGWLVGPAHLIQPTVAAATRITFCRSLSGLCFFCGLNQVLMSCVCFSCRRQRPRAGGLRDWPRAVADQRLLPAAGRRVRRAQGRPPRQARRARPPVHRPARCLFRPRQHAAPRHPRRVREPRPDQEPRARLARGVVRRQDGGRGGDPGDGLLLKGARGAGRGVDPVRVLQGHQDAQRRGRQAAQAQALHPRRLNGAVALLCVW